MTESKISLDDVRRVARLARLALDDAEAENMRAQLAKILGYVASIDALDVASIEPTFHAVEMNAPLRPDQVLQSLARHEVLAAAPANDAGGFVVPKVLEVDG